MREALCVPEERLREVIVVIKHGLYASTPSDRISRETHRMLKKWCDDMEEYING